MTNWLTVAETAERMGLSTRRIIEMCQKGHLPNATNNPNRKIGWRIPEVAIEYAQGKPWRVKTFPPTRVCRLCSEEQPINEFRLSTDGKRRRYECRSCERKGHRARYALDPAKYCGMVKASYRKHREATLARQKARRLANLEKHRLRDKVRRERYKERDREYRRRRWAGMTPEMRAADYAKWRVSHAEAAQRIRARRVHAPQIDHIDRLAIIERDGGICYLCGARPSGKQISLDHVTPLSRGGSHTADNLKVACRRCNTRKGKRLLSELPWYHPVS